MKETTNVVDKKIWNQAKRLTAGIKKPSILPHRIGAMANLEKDPEESVIVTLVDGDYVKVKYDINFSETTHEEKDGEYAEGIWVDGNLPLQDWPFFIYRSACEYKAMCQEEMSETVAHDDAVKGERELRLSAWRDRGRGL